ncbi:efflux RND transporter periplasmic adaptor subunit [Lyngbya aestuarii]|uniref:efflux RND transporter periplasmic adaptor subunit n=1 Tax=Lyngbya aestuarii TaxID=118322 RepID=UPI00403D8DBA
MTQTASEPEKHQLNGASVAAPTNREDDSTLVSVSQTDQTRPNWLGGGRGILIGMGVGIALALLGNHLATPRQEAATTEAPPATSSAAPAQSVTVAEVKTSSVQNSLEATGTVKASEMISVLSQANGLQIKQVLVDEGDYVKTGQLMARLDDAALQAQLKQAQASVAEAEARLAELKAGNRSEEIAQAEARFNQARARLRQSQASIPRQIDQAQAQVASAQARLNLAENRYKSLKGLVNQGAVTQDRFNESLSEYESARANLSEAQQRLDQARNTNSPEIEQLEAAVAEAQQQLKQQRAGSRQEIISQSEAQLARAKGEVQLLMSRLQDTRVVAPVNGKVAERKARVGKVTSSEELFQIIENSSLQLELEVPETQLPQISPGKSVTITSDVDKNLNLSGKVREIDPVVDQDSRKATVKVDLPAQDSLRPGMFLKAAITTSEAKGLTLPSKAVLPQSDGSAIVYQVSADDTVKAQSVEMGEILANEQVEIKSGLSVGDRVVVKGAAYLKDGDKIEVVESKKES